MSVGPPAEKPTTIRMGLVGQVAVCANVDKGMDKTKYAQLEPLNKEAIFIQID